MRGALVVALVGAILGGCATSYERTGFLLDGKGGLRWSNSPVVLERREPRLRGGAVQVTYSVVLDNAGPQPVDLLLSRAMARVGGLPDSATSDCRVLRANFVTDVRLPAGQRTRVDCRLRLTESGMRRLERGDSGLALVIPAVQGDTPLVLAFSYHLFREDAP